jgi:protease PrsW
MYPARRDREQGRRIVGAIVYSVLMVSGLTILALLFFVPALFDPTGNDIQAMGIGALLALPPLVVYLWLPWIIDRYDPEPWWCLLLALGWGAIAAVGFAALVNTVVMEGTTLVGGKEFGDFVGLSISAPFVEEFVKGVGVFGAFFFLRREFDGVVDGIIYATFVALGFAAVENITYYQRAALASGDALAGTFVLRGILAPWGHPLYTSMTGIGFGIARETTRSWLRWLAPIGGYVAAVILHSTWNTAAFLSEMLTYVMLPLWILFVLAFLGIVVWLVVRKGRIIRDHLKEEVLLGTLTPQELELVCSPFGRIRATFAHGGLAGRRFVAAAARLGLSKWHTGRAWRGRKMTVSADFIVPLRHELRALREQMQRAAGRPIQHPQAWQPPPAPPYVAPPRPMYPRYPPR